MPVEYSILPYHRQAAPEVSGYELAPVTGLFSIVSPAGVVTNLNDLGLHVLAYMGGGMPPIENIVTSFGVLGGSYVQRTVVRPRSITLTCIAEGRTLAVIQRIKSALIAQVAPYNSLNSSKNIKIRYQLTDFCGIAIGTTLEVAVKYTGDLTGQTIGLYQDRFDLVFTEYNPPSIKELTTIQPSLSSNIIRNPVTGLRYRTLIGDWKFISVANILAIHYDATGELWYASNATITNRSGVGTQAVNNYVYVIAHDVNNVIYAGGSFTTPQNYIMKYSAGSWSAVGATINGIVYAMAFDNSGNLYASGFFSTPAGGIGKWDGATWSALGTGTNGTVFAVVKGLDGFIYIGGSFTTANGVACANIAKWNGTTFVPLGSGTDARILSLKVLPDGRIVASGYFSTAGGVSCLHVAIWNGTQWQPLGNGLDSFALHLAVNQSTGDIYATGLFANSGTQSLSQGFAKWGGSSWSPQDANLNTITSDSAVNIDIRSSDGELALATDVANSGVSNGILNTITYTGTADVFPQIKFTGPGTLRIITNYTTGKSLYFNNYVMLAGETATFTHGDNGEITFVSSFFGNIINRVLGDKTQFSLIPGLPNYIVPYINSITGATKVELIYQNTHYSLEAGAL